MGGGKDLCFEDVAVRLHNMHPIISHPLLLPTVVGNFPLLARNHLYLPVRPLIQTTSIPSLPITCLPSQPSHLSVFTGLEGLHLHPFFFCREDGKLYSGDLHVEGSTS